MLIKLVHYIEDKLELPFPIIILLRLGLFSSLRMNHMLHFIYSLIKKLFVLHKNLFCISGLKQSFPFLKKVINSYDFYVLFRFRMHGSRFIPKFLSILSSLL